MPLHACPARCGARRRGETAKLGSAPCLPSMAPTLTRRTRRVSPSQPQRARPPANGTHSSTKGSRNPPLRQRYPSLKGSSRRLSADSRRRRHLREYRHEEAFCIAFNQDHAAGEQHLSARDVEIAGKVINLIVRELDRCGGIAHGASLVGIAQRRNAGNMRRMRCQEYRQRVLVIVVIFGTLKEVAIDRPLQMRM